MADAQIPDDRAPHDPAAAGAPTGSSAAGTPTGGTPARGGSAGGESAGGPGERARDGETEFQRRNRNFSELLQELRVAQTGVQILFAFLLTLPFSSRGDRLTGASLVAYVVTLVASAAATAFLIGPVSYHRLVFREGRKTEVLAIASRLAQLGLVALVIALVGALFLALDVVVGEPLVAVITAAVAALYVTVWYLLPVLNGNRRSRP